MLCAHELRGILSFALCHEHEKTVIMKSVGYSPCCTGITKFERPGRPAPPYGRRPCFGGHTRTRWYDFVGLHSAPDELWKKLPQLLNTLQIDSDLRATLPTYGCSLLQSITSRKFDAQHNQDIPSTQPSEYCIRIALSGRLRPRVHLYLPLIMPIDQPFNVYREQLSSQYHGIALWNPNPVDGLYDCGHVSIGDVGYLCDGDFIRMFNVSLPWNDPSNTKLGTPKEFRSLDQDVFINIRGGDLAQTEYPSPHVSKLENAGNVHAETPDE